MPIKYFHESGKGIGRGFGIGIWMAGVYPMDCIFLISFCEVIVPSTARVVAIYA